MNLDIARELYERKHAHELTFEQYISTLERGLKLISEQGANKRAELLQLKAMNIALEYNEELLVHGIINLKGNK
jgi:hypothetical protein